MSDQRQRLQGLFDLALSMGAKAERQLVLALEALGCADGALGAQVRAGEDTINRLEREIDDEVFRCLARHQLAAGDLRLVLVVARVANELERIGDEAEKIARMAVHLHQAGFRLPTEVSVHTLGEVTAGLLGDALRALRWRDAVAALQVARRYRAVDRHSRQVLRHCVSYVLEEPSSLDMALDAVWVARYLESAASHAMSIAEHVVFLVQGEEVRHRGLETMAYVALGN